MAETAFAEASVAVSDEFRALYRAFRDRGGNPPPRAAPSAPSGFAQAAGARVERFAHAPVSVVRLMRTGLRPLVFEGALVLHVSTADAFAASVWHELSVYIDHAGGVIVHAALAPRDDAGPAVMPLASAEHVADPDAFERFLATFDPAHAFAADADPGRLEQVALARADFACLVAAFCGPNHPAARAASARLVQGRTS